MTRGLWATGYGLRVRMKKARTIVGALVAVAVVGVAVEAAEPMGALGYGLRGAAPLNEEPKAPRMARVENFDVRRGRAYTSQPPTIPHAIEKYEITRNVNFCMYCHARVYNEQSQAPMVSATHYMDRDHNYLAEISPRRYFCTQCHVVQTDAQPLVDNHFLDVQQLLERERATQKKDD